MTALPHLTSTPLFRPLGHRGPRSAQRITSVATTSKVRAVTLRAGARLGDAVAEALSAAGVVSGQVELLDGTLATVSYCFPALGGDVGPVVGYCSTQTAVGPVRIVAGGLTAGFREGQRFVHCHATWFDAEGDLRGGHLWPETWVGPAGVHAVIHALEDVESISADDPESGLPVFTPHPRPVEGRSLPAGPAPAQETRRAVMSRVAAGENLVEACARIMAQHGMSNASLSGTVGSLVGAAIERPSGLLIVDGPATEVALSGRLDLRADGGVEHHIAAVAIDRHGRVHTGRLTDENIVAVTLELLLEEVPA